MSRFDLNNSQVAMSKTQKAIYPSHPPFHPSEHYPESSFPIQLSTEKNYVYAALRENLRLLGLDRRNYGKRAWNPLGEIVRKGDNVIIKPNFIRQSHLLNEDWEYVITHGSVIRAVLDYVYLALEGEGKIIVADGPQTDSDFSSICLKTGIHPIIDFYRKEAGFKIELLDLRQERWIQKGNIIEERIKLKGDPKGYTKINLAEESEFAGYGLSGKFYGADYFSEQTIWHHSNGRHEYLVSSTLLDADVVINLPKLKTHKKAGVTLSLKNMVGINGDKNYLPHFTEGTPSEEGDQFDSSALKNKLEGKYRKILYRFLECAGGRGKVLARGTRRAGELIFGSTKKTIRSGNWYGNDTIWRTILDLNKILFYSDASGHMRLLSPKRYLSIVDGIIAGEGDGPMAPDPKACGILLTGFNPVAVDIVGATLMGFDFNKIPQLKNAFQIKNFKLVPFQPEKIELITSNGNSNRRLFEIDHQDILPFKPHFGWKDHIELDSLKTY
ncbi:MAG TPA: DUF362 domain-containing protein [candidate division Zixibacteria bacterium]